MGGQMMKAAVVERYGPPETVEIRDVPVPEPADDEVLIAATATTVSSGDARLRALRVPGGMRLAVRARIGLTGPRQPILGFDTAGRVEAVGSAVTQVRPGDRVVASRGFDFGCHAEYVTVAEDGAIAPVPDGTSDQDAVSLLFGGSTALAFFRKGRLAAGETLLVNGASGAVGTMAVQIAKHMGAEVTAVCSGANAALVSDLGADHVIDHTVDDFTRNGCRYDVIMDNHGNAPYARVTQSLAPGGRFLMVVGNLWQTIAGTRQQAVVTVGEKDGAVSAAAYRELMALAGSSAIRAVVDEQLPFDRIVDAYRRVDGGHKVGAIVLTF